MIKKYIRGNALRGYEVIKALEDLGGINNFHFSGVNENLLFFISKTNVIQCIDDDDYLGELIIENFEEIILPKQKKNCFDPKTLQPFDQVLVRNGDGGMWIGTLFSSIGKIKGETCVTVLGGFFWQCVPFNEDTMHLIGTDTQAPEYYKW